MRKISGPGPGNKSHGASTLCVFACLCMCVAVTAHWYKCLCASAGSLHQTGTEREKKTVTSEGLFKKPASLESKQAIKSHSPCSPQLSFCINWLVSWTPSHTPTSPLCLSSLAFYFPSHAFPFSVCVAFVSSWVYYWDQRCSFKVLIDVRFPHDVGSCCQRSQIVCVPEWLKWRSPVSHSEPLKAARQSELLDNGSSIKHTLNLY